MPFYNTDRFIQEAIDSVLSQTWQDFELILVDDGSKDQSRAIADAAIARDARVRVIAHAGNSNRGVAASRNAGIAVAAAPRLAFIDADDRWPPQKLAQQHAIMDRHPELGLIAGATRYWRSWEGGEDELRQVGATPDRVMAPPEAMFSTYPIGHAEAPAPSSFMLTQRALDRVGGFQENFVGRVAMYEDQAFLAKVYLTQPVYFSSECWLDYRQHKDSMLTSGLARGDYLAVRAFFFSWFADYLRRSDGVDPRVRQAVASTRRKIRVAMLRQRLGKVRRAVFPIRQRG